MLEHFLEESDIKFIKMNETTKYILFFNVNIKMRIYKYESVKKNIL